MSEYSVCNFEGTNMAYWLSWLERRPVTAEVEGSSPFWVVSRNAVTILYPMGS